ncbi:MAG TPA: ATP-binding protein [Candidatus Nitrosotenuis sp.]
MSFSLYSVSGKDFIGRKEIIKELVGELASKNRIGFSLSGVRRIGKTSILKETKRVLEKKGVVVIYISAWSIVPPTVDELTKMLSRTVIAEFSKKLPKKFKFEQLLVTGAKALATFLQNLKLTSSVAKDLEISISYIRKESDDVDGAIKKSFSLLEDVAKMTNTKSVLIIDEFPSLVDLTYGTKNQKIGNEVVRLLRTLFEDFRYTKLVVSGSFRDTLENLITKERAPFYKQLLLRQIQPFDEREFEAFLQHYLPRLKFSNDDVKIKLYNITSGIPYNLQLIGKEIQYLGLAKLDEQKLDKVIEDVLKKEGEQSFKEFIAGLSPSEIKVLKGLVRNPGIAPVEISRREFIDENSVSACLNTLEKKSIIKKIERGKYDFTDNLFAAWLNQNL